MALYRDERGSPQYHLIKHFEHPIEARIRRFDRRAHRRNSPRGPERDRRAATMPLDQATHRNYTLGALAASSYAAAALLVVLAVLVLVLVARAAA